MKILHIIKTLRLGGAETNLLNLAKAFNRESIETHIGYAYGGAFEREFERQGVHLFKYSSKIPKVGSFETFFIIERLVRYVRKFKIQIIHTHNFNGHVWGALAAKITGIKVVEHVHDFRFEKAEYLRPRHVKSSQFLTAPFFARLSDRVIVLTNNNRLFLERKGIAAARIRVLRNGMDLDVPVVDSRQLRAALGIRDRQKVILYAARLSPEKNARIVIEIAKYYQKHDIIFLIAGDGPEKVGLEKNVAQKMQGKIRFLGFHPRVKELLAIVDIFIQPTLLELHSITMMEAMCMSVPVIVSRGVGCNDEFVEDGQNGFLLDPYDVNAWVKKIEELLDSPNLLKQVGAAGRKLVEQECDIQKKAAEILEIYKELVA